MFDITVPAGDSDRRLDRYLISLGHSFGVVQKAVRLGHVRVNGKKSRADTRLNTGDTLRLPGYMQAETPEHRRDTVPDWLEGCIIYADADMMVLNKPAGIAVQGGSKIEHSLDTMLRARTPEAPPKLVHRLDKDTSGLLVVARHAHAARVLTEAFRAHTIDKRYLAIVCGTLTDDSGTVTTRLAKQGQPGNQTVQVVDSGGSLAETGWSILRRHQASQHYLVELCPKTGRMHQLRVHCQHLGAPIAGDGKYGEKARPPLAPRLHLHAARLTLAHPQSGHIQTFNAPLPDHFHQAARAFGWRLPDLSGPKRHGRRPPSRR